jgi:WD40 repeat protein
MSNGFYDFLNNRLNKLQGRYPFINADRNRIITESKEGDQIYVYDGSQLLFKLQGTDASFNPKGNRIITEAWEEEDPLTYVYDISGNFLSKLQGSYADFSDIGDRIATSLFEDNLSYVYDESGSFLFDLQGIYAQFNATGDRILTKSSENDLNYIYDSSGRLLNMVQSSEFSTFNATGDRILTQSSIIGGAAFIYDNLGNFLLGFQNSNFSIRYEGDRLVANSIGSRYLYDEVCNCWHELKGNDVVSSVTEDYILVDSSEKEYSRLYNSSGQFLKDLKGGFPRFSANGKQIATTSQSEDISRIYDLSGNLLAEYPGSLPPSYKDSLYFGSSLGFTPDGQRFVTISKDGYLRIYRFDNGLDDLLARGCAWARTYLENYPEEKRGRFCLEKGRGF